MTTPTTTSGPALLSHEECVEIVRNFSEINDFELKAFKLTAIKDASGYLGEYHHLVFELMKSQESRNFIYAADTEINETKIIKTTTTTQNNFDAQQAEAICCRHKQDRGVGRTADDDRKVVLASAMAAQNFGSLAESMTLSEESAEKAAASSTIAEPDTLFILPIENEIKYLSFFVKSLPTQSTEIAKSYIFKKEAKLLTTLLKDMQALSTLQWCPSAYYARDDLIVMEDLQQREYRATTKTLDAVVGMKQLIRSLAAMHAASIAYEVKHQVNIGTVFMELLAEITVSPDIAWCSAGMAAVSAVIAAHPSYQNTAAQSFIQHHLSNCLAQVYGMVNTSARYCNVVCQRDAWAANVFLPTASNHSDGAVIVDYQTCRYCPPSIDLLLALYMNMTHALRQQHEADYLHWYYSHFERDLRAQNIAAAEHMSFQELLASFEEFRLFGCVYNAIAATLIRVPIEYVTNEYKYVSRTEKVLRYMQENVEFRELMNGCVEEIMEIIYVT